MASYTIIYGDTADTGVYVNSTSYATARNSTAATDQSAATTQSAGQNFVTPNYYIQQYFGVFDTSAVPSGALPASLSLNVTVASGGGYEWQVREASSLSNKIAGGSLSGLTLFGTTAIPTVTGRRVIPIADISAMSRSATTILLVHSKNEADNVAPTGTQLATVNTANATGTTNDPYLAISTTGAWQFVGISNVVESITDNITLVETGITGLQAGDLLVACIAYRSAAGGSVFSAPGSSIWNTVAQVKTDNTLTTTSAVASGAMFYGIRGASAPALTFTRTAGANVALGQIVAYRNVAQSSPLDANNGGATSAVNTTAVSLAGLTTTQGEDLIVAMFAGGQEATVLNFAAATDPTSASFDTSPTGHPVPNKWIERADNNTTTGADTALSIFDAVKVTAGATGNLTCTASLPASHVIVAGAFKIGIAATTLSIARANLGFATQALSINAKRFLAAAAVSLGWTPRSASPRAVLAGSKASLPFTAAAAGVRNTIGVAKGALDWTARAFSVGESVVLAVATAAFGLTARAFNVSGSTVLAIAAAAFGLTPRAVSVNAQQWLQASAAALGLTPHAANINAQQWLQTAAATLGWTPQAANVNAQHWMQAATATLGWTPRSAAASSRLPLASAGLAYTAPAAALRQVAGLARATLSWTTRAFSLSGSVVLDVATAALGWTVNTAAVRSTVQVAAAALSWAANTAAVRLTLHASSAALSWTAQAFSVTIPIILAMATAALSWTANTAAVRFAVRAGPAALSWTAHLVSVSGSIVLVVATAALNWTANTAAIRLTAQVGTAALSWTTQTASIIGAVFLAMARVSWSIQARPLGVVARTLRRGLGRYRIIIPAGAPLWAQQLQVQFNDILARIEADMRRGDGDT